MSKRRYDYYALDVPSDLADDPQERADIAIREAREQARLHCLPCKWTILADDGENVRVRRIRNR